MGKLIEGIAKYKKTLGAIVLIGAVFVGWATGAVDFADVWAKLTEIISAAPAE